MVSQINAKSIKEARYKAVDLITSKGKTAKDERGDWVQYIKHGIIIIDADNCEFSEDPFTRECQIIFGDNLITGEDPKPEVIAPNPDVQKPAYSYGREAHENGMVETTIQNIRDHPESRRHVIPIFKVKHVGKEDIPCMINVVHDIEDDFLNLTILGRSNEAAIAMQTDLKGYEIFLRWVAWRTGYDAGTILLHDINLHVRINSEADLIKKILQERY